MTIIIDSIGTVPGLEKLQYICKTVYPNSVARRQEITTKTHTKLTKCPAFCLAPISHSKHCWPIQCFQVYALSPINNIALATWQG